jgi:hypothetical protein
MTSRKLTIKNESHAKFYFIIVFLVFLITALVSFIVYSKFNLNSNNRVLSAESIASIQRAVNSSPITVGAMVVEVQLQSNSRRGVYTYIKHPEVKKLYETFVRDRISPDLPFFTGEIQDERLIRIINHEFICTPFIETLGYKYSPASEKYIKFVCTMSVPPSYGRFHGLAAIYLSNEPSDIEKDRIRIYLKEISEQISIELK